MHSTPAIHGPSVTRVQRAAELLCRPEEEVLASAWSRLAVTPDEWGLGFWFLAVPVGWVRRRRERKALSSALGLPLPEYGAVAVTTQRLLFFRTDRLIVTPPRLVGAVDRMAVRRVERPTVGGYLRHLNIWIGDSETTEIKLPLLVVGDPGDAAAEALRVVHAGA